MGISVTALIVLVIFIILVFVLIGSAISGIAYRRKG